MRQGLLPAPDAAQVWLDFDGTISRRDVLDELIATYAVSESWKLVEERWQAGLIGSRECLRQEFAMVRISPAELTKFLAGCDVDPATGELLELLAEHRIPTTILSDGIESFIRIILTEHGLEIPPIRANRIVHRGDRLRLVCPYRRRQCDSSAAHCKCFSMAQLRDPSRQSIYIGDGRSDLCPARKADHVFAKGALARALTAERFTCIPFMSLADVVAVLLRAWSKAAAAI